MNIVPIGLTSTTHSGSSLLELHVQFISDGQARELSINQWHIRTLRPRVRHSRIGDDYIDLAKFRDCCIYCCLHFLRYHNVRLHCKDLSIGTLCQDLLLHALKILHGTSSEDEYRSCASVLFRRLLPNTLRGTGDEYDLVLIDLRGVMNFWVNIWVYAGRRNGTVVHETSRP